VAWADYEEVDILSRRECYAFHGGEEIDDCSASKATRFDETLFTGGSISAFRTLK
jgi:hypothetical protein